MEDPAANFDSAKVSKSLQQQQRQQQIVQNKNVDSFFLDVSKMFVCSLLTFLFLFSNFSVCALPVAKRNFLKRHGHGLVFTAQQLKENVDAVYCRVIPSDEPIIEESASSNAITDNEASDAPSVGSEESTAGAEDIVLTVDHVPHQQQHPLMVSFEGKKQLHFPTTVVDENTPASVVSDVSVGPIDGSFTELSNDEKQWLSLFRQRPCVEEQSLTHWMDKVLTVASDNTTTVAPPQTALTAPPSLIAPISPFQQPTVASSIKIEQPYTVPLDIEIDPLLIAEQEEESALITAPSSPALSFTSEPVVERNNVPLVEPGMRISEENFAAAVMGIDFSLIFE